jgi:hypothetical protein
MTQLNETFNFAGHAVKRLGYGAMQLAGKGVFGPPKDKAEAIAVLKEAIASGVNHIDTSDFYPSRAGAGTVKPAAVHSLLDEDQMVDGATIDTMRRPTQKKPGPCQQQFGLQPLATDVVRGARNFRGPVVTGP